MHNAVSADVIGSLNSPRLRPEIIEDHEGFQKRNKEQGKEAGDAMSYTLCTDARRKQQHFGLSKAIQ